MTDSEPFPIAIDVYSDVVCPWCFLGKRRLETALAMVPDIVATIRWLPFRLDPTIPPGGIARGEYLTKKFGDPENYEPMYAQLEELGTAERIDFRFDLISRSPNTVDAHRLIRWSAQDGSQEAVVERLFQAYFTEGQDVGELAALLAAADDAGMDHGDTERRLRSDEDRQLVEDEVANAYKIGIRGVPCFVIDGKYAVMGAQDSSVLADAFMEITASRQTH